MRIRGATFDLDGTLVDLECLHHQSHLRAASETAGIDLNWKEAFDQLEHFIGGPDELVASEIAGLSSRGVSSLDVLQSKRRHFLSLLAMTDSIVPRPGVRAVLNYLANYGVPLAVGTVSHRSLAVYIMQESDLLTFFGEENVVAAGDVNTLKPAPDVYIETALRLGIDPVCQLVFEDSVTGTKAARSSASRVVAVPSLRNKYFLRALSEAGAEQIFSGWQDPSLLPFVQQLLTEDIETI